MVVSLFDASDARAALYDNIPVAPGTGGFYAAGQTGAGGQEMICGERMPVFTLEVIESLDVDFAGYYNNQYGYVGVFKSAYSFYCQVMLSIGDLYFAMGPDGCNQRS